jgi:hypothetical protein
MPLAKTHPQFGKGRIVSAKITLDTLIEKNRDERLSPTAQSNMGSEFRYEMAHQQRIILERGDLADLFRLVPPNERAAFREMLEHELRGHELPDGKLRRLAERAWHKFRYRWPAAK